MLHTVLGLWHRNLARWTGPARIRESPSRPCRGACLLCMGVIDPERLRIELLPAAERKREVELGYIRGANVEAPAVVSLNAITASLAMMSFLRWAVGEQPLLPAQWVYRTYAGDVRRQTVEPQSDCPVCRAGKRLGRADLDISL